MNEKISIIVPAYNEEKRIKKFLDELYLFSKNLKNYEIILVNDGSKDKTLEIFNSYKDKNTKIISHKKNKGKGAAVQNGILKAEGDKIIFIDADGSINPSEISRMVPLLDKYDVVVGDRSLKESYIKINLLRHLMGVSFNFIVKTFYSMDIDDNLCGFKGFKKKKCIELFNNLISKRWIFDVELYYKIKKKNIKMYKMPIKWIHKSGSKIKLIDPLKIFFNLIILRIKLIEKRGKLKKSM